MEWYWWGLIGIGCVIIAVVKIKVFGKIMSKKKNRNVEEED